MKGMAVFVVIFSIAIIANGAELMAFRITRYRSIWTYSFNSEMVPEFVEGAAVSFRLVGLLKNVTKVAMTSSTSDCTVLQPGTISDTSSAISAMYIGSIVQTAPSLIPALKRAVSSIIALPAKKMMVHDMSRGAESNTIEIWQISLKSDQEATTAITMPNLLQNSQVLYFCFKVSENTWNHQGSEDWAYIIVQHRILSLPILITMIIVCVCLSGLLNGLVLGLMSLDITELKVIANAGGEKEKKYGKAILSVRKTGNFLLISLVVGATTLNSTVTVLIDSFVSEWMTVLIVTLTIVLFCEIIPNSIVSRFALTIGAKTIYLTWMVMILTSPVSFPLGKLLDKMLGEDIPNLTRDRLKELVRITANVSALKKTEIDMISGALEMSARKVEDIMTLLEDVYSIPIETRLDYESIREIIASGYSRIPIYDGEKSNIVRIMYVRDLALIDPEDKTPLALFSKLMADQEMVYFDEGTTIDAVFNIFKEGVHGHMAFVVKRRDENEVGPPVVTGLLTLEDIIEEIVQVEIVDEYDVIVDNRSKRKRQRYRMISDYMSVFADSFESKNVLISPNLRIAALNFLASELKEFSPDVISPKVMQRLLRQGVIVHLPAKKPKSVNPLIFSQSQAQEGFVMILEGRAQIVIGPDNLRCECGPFSYFGLGILSDTLDDKIVYGFAVEAVGEVRYLKIPRELYQAAIEATEIEKGKTGNVPNPYRGLLADDDDKELGDSSAHSTDTKHGSSKSGKDVSFHNLPRSKRSSAQEQSPKPNSRFRSSDQSQSPPSAKTSSAPQKTDDPSPPPTENVPLSTPKANDPVPPPNTVDSPDDRSQAPSTEPDSPAKELGDSSAHLADTKPGSSKSRKDVGFYNLPRSKRSSTQEQSPPSATTSSAPQKTDDPSPPPTDVPPPNAVDSLDDRSQGPSSKPETPAKPEGDPKDSKPKDSPPKDDSK